MILTKKASLVGTNYTYGIWSHMAYQPELVYLLPATISKKITNIMSNQLNCTVYRLDINLLFFTKLWKHGHSIFDVFSLNSNYTLRIKLTWNSNLLNKFINQNQSVVLQSPPTTETIAWGERPWILLLRFQYTDRISQFYHFTHNLHELDDCNMFKTFGKLETCTTYLYYVDQKYAAIVFFKETRILGQSLF